MTIRDLQVLEVWQSNSERNAEKELDKLVDTIDLLTTLCQYREGARVVRANHHQVKAALIKLHDLYIETMPVNGVAA